MLCILLHSLTITKKEYSWTKYTCLIVYFTIVFPLNHTYWLSCMCIWQVYIAVVFTLKHTGYKNRMVHLDNPLINDDDKWVKTD